MGAGAMTDDIIARARRMATDAREGAAMAHEEGKHKYGSRLEGAAESINELLCLLDDARKDRSDAHAVLDKVGALTHMIGTGSEENQRATLAERIEDALKMAAVPTAAPEALSIGARVGAKHKPEHDCEYTHLRTGARKQHDGDIGTIVASSDSHGLCFRVQFPTGQAWYEADELTPKPAATRVFEPTPEELAACPVLTEVAGKPEREAVLLLAWRITLARLTNGELSKANGDLREEIERTHKKAMSFPAFGKSQRPRVGPWVKGGAGILYRFDDRGQQVAKVDPMGGANKWWAVRPFQEEARGFAREDGQDVACDAADAVLREWADLDS